MKLIPVIDLMHGHVVRARHGLRSQYRPVESKLAKGSRPEGIVAALLDFYSFDTLYFADLDAIEQRGDHFSTIEKLASRFRQVEFWVDAGIREARNLERWSKTRFRLIVASESMAEISLLQRDAVLSLDFDGPCLRGPSQLLSSPDLWPQDVIVMSLKRVGSELGPDFERLTELKKLAPGKKYYCAGGVRGLQDVLTAKTLGAEGILLASALHDGALSAVDIAGAVV
ncbi:MAG: HisA/HisF-related TIM barrel protein [Burkholderiales bacterium]